MDFDSSEAGVLVLVFGSRCGGEVVAYVGVGQVRFRSTQ